MTSDNSGWLDVQMGLVGGALRTLLMACLLLIPIPNTLAESAPTATPSSTQSSTFWRDLKHGEAGVTAARSQDAGIAINIHGQNWRQARNRILAPWGAWLMGSVLVLIAAFYAIRGPIELPRGTDDKPVHRFTPYQRIAHWFVVSLFLLLSLTGLILLYGRAALEPLFGADGFSAVASGAKEAHNLFGPLFLFGLLLLIPAYIRDNLPSKADLNWFAALGGYFRNHASAPRFNAGEKLWFWLVCIFGLGLSITGLMLDFTFLGFTRPAIELAHFIHVTFAFVTVAVAFGHIYLATAGTEGTLRGMVGGTVERRWAARHHALWLKEMESGSNDVEPEHKP